jgi:hypothetical protein
MVAPSNLRVADVQASFVKGLCLKLLNFLVLKPKGLLAAGFRRPQ